MGTEAGVAPSRMNEEEDEGFRAQHNPLPYQDGMHCFMIEAKAAGITSTVHINRLLYKASSPMAAGS